MQEYRVSVLTHSALNEIANLAFEGGGVALKIAQPRVMLGSEQAKDIRVGHAHAERKLAL